jgi:hypothetical protein
MRFAYLGSWQEPLQSGSSLPIDDGGNPGGSYRFSICCKPLDQRP